MTYQDPVTKNRYVFVTNNTTWVAQTIADIYKSRWQIELFFKWIKQHLKVKRFVGRSKNAVMTQLWVAMCMYLLLAYLKFVMRLRWSLHQMLQVLQLNMFERRPLQDLFTTPSLPAPSWLPIVAGVVLKMWDTSDSRSSRSVRCWLDIRCRASHRTVLVAVSTAMGSLAMPSPDYLPTPARRDSGDAR